MMKIKIELSNIKIANYNCWTDSQKADKSIIWRQFGINYNTFNKQMQLDIPLTISTIEKHEILAPISDKTLQGRVFLAKQVNQLRAIKVFHKSNDFNNQWSVLKRVQSKYVVQLIEAHPKGEILLEDGSIIFRPIIIMQFALYGDLFSIIEKTGSLPQPVCRTILLQLIQAVQQTHKAGISHRDIKTQNILINKSGIKLADYGLATESKGDDTSGFLYRGVGTPKYWAPEIYKRKYQGQSVDIFSIGIVLFIIYGQSLPFGKASIDDYHYRILKSQNQNHVNYYWKQVAQRIDHKNQIPSQLKQLFTQIFAENPSQRATLQQIRISQWMTGEKASKQELQACFSQRFRSMIENSRPQSSLRKIQVILKSIDQDTLSKKVVLDIQTPK